jgi:Ni/Co efflux regulator RcnB
MERERVPSVRTLFDERGKAMNRLYLSAIAACFAIALPTALWAADDHHDKAPPSHASHGSGGAPSGQHGSGGGSSAIVHRTHVTHTTSGPTHHTYSFGSSINTHGHMTTGHHPVADVSKFRRNVTAERRFHWGDYRGPSDYSYRRWGYGETLPVEYWAQDYWINNFLNFGLDVPPDGYVWVRYGPDALLVDEDTGEIIEVEYGIFY